jgi:hypothetical protein
MVFSRSHLHSQGMRSDRLDRKVDPVFDRMQQEGRGDKMKFAAVFPLMAIASTPVGSQLGERGTESSVVRTGIIA